LDESIGQIRLFVNVARFSQKSHFQIIDGIDDQGHTGRCPEGIPGGLNHGKDMVDQSAPSKNQYTRPIEGIPRIFPISFSFHTPYLRLTSKGDNYNICSADRIGMLCF
jgi:hypothetical protein